MSGFAKKMLIEFSIAAVIIIGLAVGVWFFGRNIKTFSEKISESRHELARRSDAVRHLAALQSDYNRGAAQYLNVLYNVIPKRDELIDLARQLQAIGTDIGVTTSFSFIGESGATKEQLGIVQFTLSASGDSAEDIFVFVEKLQKFRYLIDIESVSFGPDADKVKGTIKGKVFFRA